MDKEKVTKVLEMIETDMKADATKFDGQPFTGRTVAEYFGCQGAAIAALAKIVKELIDDTDSLEGRGDGFFRRNKSSGTSLRT